MVVGGPAICIDLLKSAGVDKTRNFPSQFHNWFGTFIL